MNMTEILQILIDDTNLSNRKFAEKVGVPPTTLYNMFKNGCEKSSVNIIISICDFLKVNIEDVRKLALKEDATKEDVLHLKELYNLSNSDSIVNKIKERPDLFKVMQLLEKLDFEDIQSLIDALNDATPEDIALISSLLKKFSHK